MIDLSTVSNVVDPYIDEIDQLNKKLDKFIDLLEITEALTTDKTTANRIRKFLQQEGIWQDK